MRALPFTLVYLPPVWVKDRLNNPEWPYLGGSMAVLWPRMLSHQVSSEHAGSRLRSCSADADGFSIGQHGQHALVHKGQQSVQGSELHLGQRVQG